MGRLVVLFAKTGTGKTSLINAGVRPLLEDRGYETFLIRVQEEFFLFAVRVNPEEAWRFIADLYHDDDSSVHIVLSMREEFFVELDMFRDEFPDIFGEDSSLRLGWFDESQARETITRPALTHGVTVDPKLVDALGEPSVTANVAQQMLSKRLEEDLERVRTNEQLTPLQQVLPRLRTDRRTKRVWGFPGLREALAADEATLRELVDQLAQSHLLRVII